MERAVVGGLEEIQGELYSPEREDCKGHHGKMMGCLIGA